MENKKLNGLMIIGLIALGYLLCGLTTMVDTARTPVKHEITVNSPYLRGDKATYESHSHVSDYGPTFAQLKQPDGKTVWGEVLYLNTSKNGNRVEVFIKDHGYLKS